MSHLVKELKTEEPKAKKAKKENSSLATEFESKKNVVALIAEELASLPFNPDLEGPLVATKNQLEKKVKALQRVLLLKSFRLT